MRSTSTVCQWMKTGANTNLGWKWLPMMVYQHPVYSERSRPFHSGPLVCTEADSPPFPLRVIYLLHALHHKIYLSASLASLEPTPVSWSIKSHIGVWYCSFWSEGSKTQPLNLTILVPDFVPRGTPHGSAHGTSNGGAEAPRMAVQGP